MDGPGISQEQMDRLSGVSRTTRQNWAKAGLLAKQIAPFSLAVLREVVVLCDLRTHAVVQAEDAFRQLRPGLEAAVDRPPPIEAIVDLRTGRAAWITGDNDIAAAARRGNAVQVVDVTRNLSMAQEGFELMTRAAAAPDDEVGARRRARAPRKRRSPGSPA